jgi:hypothetical protein
VHPKRRLGWRLNTQPVHNFLPSAASADCSLSSRAGDHGIYAPRLSLPSLRLTGHPIEGFTISTEEETSPDWSVKSLPRLLCLHIFFLKPAARGEHAGGPREIGLWPIRLIGGLSGCISRSSRLLVSRRQRHHAPAATSSLAQAQQQWKTAGLPVWLPARSLQASLRMLNPRHHPAYMLFACSFAVA